MINFIKSNLIYLIIIGLFIYKGLFVNLVSNINLLFTKSDNQLETKVKLLEADIANLNKDLEEVTNLKTIKKDNYKLTKLSYRLSFSDNNFYITGSDYKVNDLLINSSGLVGIIMEVNKDYSLAKTIKDVKNISIKINDSYGTIEKYQDEYFVITNLSNYDKVAINDEVYTSVLGSIDNNILVGYVAKIEEHDINKTIYVKSKVDFNNINYLYVVSA